MAPRRSTRLHPQNYATEQGAGMVPRRRHPQIEPTADGAGATRRRSPRLHPQIHAREEVAAGMARPTGTSPAEPAASLPDEIGRSEQGARVACLRPQIQPRDDDVGVTSPHSPPLHPQIHDSDEEGAGVACLVRSTSLAAADASLPGDDDMLREILLRLPPQPSSLPRASAVCKRWLGLVTDPKFHRQFYAHHRKPPLLGVFSCSRRQGIVFDPILDPPDRMLFSLGSYSWSSWSLGCRVPMHVLDCRHGLLLLLKNQPGTDVVVCDPITGEELSLAIPPELRTDFLSGAVLCAASDLDHVHCGGCYSSPFKLVLVSSGRSDGGGDLACVYSSETGVWGDLISTAAPYWVSYKPAVLVVRSSRLRMALLDSLHCLILASKCGGGTLLVRVLPHGSTARPLRCLQFLGSLLRPRDCLHESLGIMRILMCFSCMWVTESTWFNLSRCSPRNFINCLMA